MPIRSAWLSNDNIDWKELARRKYAILRQRAQAEAKRARAAMLEEYWCCKRKSKVRPRRS